MSLGTSVLNPPLLGASLTVAPSDYLKSDYLKTDPAVTVLMLLICIHAALAFASKMSIVMPKVH